MGTTIKDLIKTITMKTTTTHSIRIWYKYQIIIIQIEEEVVPLIDRINKGHIDHSKTNKIAITMQTNPKISAITTQNLSHLINSKQKIKRIKALLFKKSS